MALCKLQAGKAAVMQLGRGPNDDAFWESNAIAVWESHLGASSSWEWLSLLINSSGSWHVGCAVVPPRYCDGDFGAVHGTAAVASLSPDSATLRLRALCRLACFSSRFWCTALHGPV